MNYKLNHIRFRVSMYNCQFLNTFICVRCHPVALFILHYSTTMDISRDSISLLFWLLKNNQNIPTNSLLNQNFESQTCGRNEYELPFLDGYKYSQKTGSNLLKKSIQRSATILHMPFNMDENSLVYSIWRKLHWTFNHITRNYKQCQSWECKLLYFKLKYLLFFEATYVSGFLFKNSVRRFKGWV